MLIIFKTVGRNQASYHKLQELNEKNKDLGLKEIESPMDDTWLDVAIDINSVESFECGTTDFNTIEYPSIQCTKIDGTFTPHIVCTLWEFLNILEKCRPELVIKTKEDIIDEINTKDSTNIA